MVKNPEHGNPDEFKGPFVTADAEVEKMNESEGVEINNIPEGSSIWVKTRHTNYILERREDGLYISGHKTYCPTPIAVDINGSSFGGGMIRTGFIGLGMNLEYSTLGKDGHKNIITSPIEHIDKIEKGSSKIN